LDCIDSAAIKMRQER